MNVDAREVPGTRAAGPGGAGVSRLVDVENLVVGFDHGRIRAVDDISFQVREGECFGIAGESGSGKTTTIRSLLGLTPISSGRVSIGGHDVTSMSKRQWRDLRRFAQMVYQDPGSSLDRMMTIGALIEEGLVVHNMVQGRPARRARALELAEMVGLTAPQLDVRPPQLSGGQLQRVAIARALAVEPRLLVCDEVVSALDVSVQAQVLMVLKNLQRRLSLTIVFISHDLGVLSFLCDRVAVMSQGRIVEVGRPSELVSGGEDPYTRELLACSPEPDPRLERERRRERIAVRTAEESA